MPSVQHARIVTAPFAQVWPFVRDMDNWAPLVTGYQRHEKLSDTESVWHLKGELGGLTRVAEFRAVVTEWDEDGRVSFTLQGVNEPVTGDGDFLAAPLAGKAAPAAAVAAEPTTRPGFLARLRTAVARLVYDRLFGSRNAPAAFPRPSPATGAGEETRITLRLNVNAGGMAGPVLNMLISPMLRPVAEDLANGIAARIERDQPKREPTNG